MLRDPGISQATRMHLWQAHCAAAGMLLLWQAAEHLSLLIAFRHKSGSETVHMRIPGAAPSHLQWRVKEQCQSLKHVRHCGNICDRCVGVLQGCSCLWQAAELDSLEAQCGLHQDNNLRADCGLVCCPNSGAAGT